MTDDCTGYWLENNKFSFQYLIEEFELEVYKNHQSIVIIDSRSVMKSMYPIGYFVENNLDERSTIVDNYLNSLKNTEKRSMERLDPEKKRKIKEDVKILKEIENHNQKLEMLWSRIKNKK